MPVKTNRCTMMAMVKEECFDNSYELSSYDYYDSMYDGVEFTDYPEAEFNTIPPDFFAAGGTLAIDAANPYICSYLTNDLNKYQIRNHDCMWSGRCGEHPEKSKNNLKLNNNNGSNNSCSKVNNNNNKVNNIIINNNNNNNSKITSQHIQHIQPGDSLLRNNNNSNNINNNSCSNNSNVNSKAPKLPNISTTDFLKERETYNASNIVRPDTPISLDDDPPTFKHNIDLAACTMGSNNMSLVNPEEISSARIIGLLKEHLEDTSSEVVPKPFLTTCKTESLSDILKTLHELKEIPNYDDEDGEEEDNVDDDEDDEDDDDDDLNSNHDEEDGDDINGDSDSESNYSMNNNNNNSSNNNNNNNNNSVCNQNDNLTTNPPAANQQIKLEYQATHVGDHCYTRCKNRVDPAPLGVQTPSDSEEEIDVVSVGDKTLPTNPSARDRRALQTTVAVKIKTARMEKTPRGIKGGQVRRQYSEEDSFTSSCHSTPTKLNQTINFTGGTAIQCTDITSSRKRSHPKDSSGNTSSSSSSSGGTKRHRGKKSKSPGKRQNSDSDEADTIEKRNLHNDMERQRRIGLKNLFEELKCQIPNIKDKERAPKVSILREAATLCNKLNREQEQLAQLKKTQQRLMNRVKCLRTSLASQWG